MGGYQNQRTGQWETTDDISLADAKSVSGASGEGTAVEVGAKGTRLLDLTPSAIGAGTTLTITVKTCKTADGTFRTLGTFAGATDTTAQRVSFAGCDRYARADWALAAGTTTATYTVSGEAV
jgi:hypothetical protein